MVGYGGRWWEMYAPAIICSTWFVCSGVPQMVTGLSCEGGRRWAKVSEGERRSWKGGEAYHAKVGEGHGRAGKPIMRRWAKVMEGRGSGSSGESTHLSCVPAILSLPTRTRAPVVSRISRIWVPPGPITRPMTVEATAWT